ncbi:MAG: hypothetical protein AAFY26_06065 [Cyanobacteria bacterium J06638_22]
MIAYKLENLKTKATQTKFFPETTNRAALKSIFRESGYRIISAASVF